MFENCSNEEIRIKYIGRLDKISFCLLNVILYLITNVIDGDLISYIVVAVTTMPVISFGP